MERPMPDPEQRYKEEQELIEARRIQNQMQDEELRKRAEDEKKSLDLIHNL
jgi:hypothetical protein